jgi:O-antigen/teichoic acid export membrane protein
MLVALVPLELAMGWMIRVFLGTQYEPAIPAARVILVAAAIQVVFGWSKSFPVSIGRPGLRIWASGIEAAVMLPLILVFGSLWGATGAAVAVVVSSAAYAAAWIVILMRLRRGPLEGPVTA